MHCHVKKIGEEFVVEIVEKGEDSRLLTVSSTAWVFGDDGYTKIPVNTDFYARFNTEEEAVNAAENYVAENKLSEPLHTVK